MNMYMWALTLLIGAQYWAPSHGEFHVANVFLEFPIDHQNLSDLNLELGRVLKNFLAPSSFSLIRDAKMKTDYGSHNEIHWHIPAIGSSILNEIDTLSKPFGISDVSSHDISTIPPPFTTTYIPYPPRLELRRSDRFDFRDSVYHELIEFPWKLLPLGKNAVSNLQEYSIKNRYINRGYLPWSSSPKNTSRPKKSSNLMTTSLINKSKHYAIGLRQCLSSRNSDFNLPKSVISITRHSPKITASIVKRRFQKSVPYHPLMKKRIYNEYEAMTCHALATSKEDHQKCLKELKRIGNCVTRRMEKSAEPKMLRRHYTRNLWPSAAKLVRDISSLNSSCKVENNSLTISCFSFKQAGNTFDWRFFIAKWIGTSKVAEATTKKAEKIVKLMMKSDLGCKALDEVGTYIYIYHKGLETQKKLGKMAKNNHRLRRQYKKVSKNVEEYKNHLINVALGAIDDVRTTATNMEQTLVKTISQFLGINFSEHVRSMRCLNTLIDAMVAPWFGGWAEYQGSRPKPVEGPVDHGESDEESQSDGDGDENGEDSGNDGDDNNIDGNNDDHNYGDDYGDVAYPIASDENKVDEENTEVDLPENTPTRLMNSLKRLSQTKLRRKQSTIVSLANTFLLATMFYECITVLAAAVYRTEHIPDHESTTVHQIANAGTPVIAHGSSQGDRHEDGSWDNGT